VTRLDLAAQHPLLPTFALIILVYLACLGGVGAAQLAWRGRPAYWLALLGVFCFLVGALWGRGYLSGGATFTFVGAGIVLTVFGVALDLIFGPPFGRPSSE
jgi:hypothetical protein